MHSSKNIFKNIQSSLAEILLLSSEVYYIIIKSQNQTPLDDGQIVKSNSESPTGFCNGQGL